MTGEQKKARSILQRERAEAGLSTDMDELIEKYRVIDQKYASALEGVIGPSEKKNLEK